MNTSSFHRACLRYDSDVAGLSATIYLAASCQILVRVNDPRIMIPASGTGPEPAENPFIFGKFPQVPMLFLLEPTGKILGTWQQCSGRKNFVQEDARLHYFPDAGNEEEIVGISKGTA